MPTPTATERLREYHLLALTLEAPGHAETFGECAKDGACARSEAARLAANRNGRRHHRRTRGTMTRELGGDAA